MSILSSQRILSVFLLLTILGCTDGENSAPPDDGSSSLTSVAPAKSGDASIVADPNPIEICEFPKVGATTLSWKTADATMVEIRIGSPSGDLFGRRGSDGSATTGKWIQDGLEFYLQDISHDQPLTAEHTLATVKVSVTDAHCP